MPISQAFRSIIAAAAVTSTAAAAFAQQEVVLHEGDNQVPSFAAVVATFTPDRDCKVLIEAADQYEVKYDGTTYAFSYVPTNNPPQVCEISDVKSGTTVTLTSSFVMNPLVRITTFASGEVIPVEMNSSIPAVGSDDFWPYNGILSLTFNKQVMLSGAMLEAEGVSERVNITHVTSTISMDLSSTLKSLLTNGSLTPGQSFDIVLSNLHDANDNENLYNGDGVLRLSYRAPQPQYDLLSASVGGQQLSTSTLNDYTFLSYYSPEGEDGLFVLEFENEVGDAADAVLQMGSRDLSTQGKYYEGALPVSVDGNRLLVDARGVLRTLNILFPAVVEEEGEAGETVNEGLGEYDKEHITLRVSNVKDKNGNYFRAEQAGNVGSYSYYMHYRELMETINMDGDNKMAGEDVWAGEEIRLWLGNDDVKFDGILVSYVAVTLDEEGLEVFEPRSVLQPDFTTEPDPYQGIIITFTMPQMPNVAEGQTVRVSLYNASSADGMPHDLSIEYKAGDPGLGIEQLHNDATATQRAWSLQGTPLDKDALPKGQPVIVGRSIFIIQ